MLTKNVCMIGTFPPPIHGMSNVNSQVFLLLSGMNHNAKMIDTSPPQWLGSPFARFLKPLKIILSLVYLGYLSITLRPTIYIGISGGFGQLYEIFYILISRVFNHRLFIHHHSYAYINKKSIITSLVTYLAGSRATHILLCEDMALKFKNSYPTAQNTFTLSNSCFINQSKNNSCPSDFDIANISDSEKHFKSFSLNIELYKTPTKLEKTIKFGFLGNITIDKGILDFLKIVELIKNKNLPYMAIVAGPCKSKDLLSLINLQALDNQLFKYIGAVYDDEKIGFFNEIDILVFPTNYINEAEPLTILEAMSHSVPVISKSRGCISSIISEISGWIIEDDQDFPDEALKIIQQCHTSPLEMNQKKLLSGSYYQNLKNENHEKLLNLISCM